jgi:2-oxoglutarate dehydrogenase E2 component (dihydrolipoamide succinyltransferase)
MAVEVKVPAVGESVSEGTLSRWFKQDGEAVRVDEPLFELETEKATTEVAAPAAGTLRIAVAEGETVAVGAVVARVEDGAAPPRPSPAAPKQEQAAKPDKEVPPAKPVPQGDARAATAGAPAAGEVLLSPAARRLAEEEGLDVGQLRGSGPGGRVTKEDVLAHLEQRRAQPGRPPPEAPPPPREEGRVPAAKPEAPRETRQRQSSIRQRIAERLVAAQHTAAILTTFNEADLSAVLELRNRYKEAFRQKHDVGLGFMSFFVKACVEGLRAFPVLNARLEGNDIVFPHDHHIGVAVSTDKGLMVPVVRNAGGLSFAAIEKRITELALKARDGKISVDDLQGGTFTITNGGVFGSLLSTPILNPPQSGILGMHAIQKRPVVVDDEVVIRPMMYLALSYDHRLIDGREAVLFLVRVKECIENPERLLLEV